jgi:hypothetical protein
MQTKKQTFSSQKNTLYYFLIFMSYSSYFTEGATKATNACAAEVKEAA